MSGHSRWANIKHKKAKSDVKKGKLFTKIVREIIVAAKLGGADASANPRLRTAVEKAKAVNLPSDNIERAIKKGSRELEGVNYEEGAYEGYGPGGVAVLVNYMTDNKNRTASDIRHAFTSSGGSLGQTGSVGWMFEKKGYITFDIKALSEDKLMEAAIEAGAEDVVSNPADGVFEVYTEPLNLHKVKTSFDESGLKYIQAEITMLPKTFVKVEGKIAQQVLRLMEELEDLDDVQSVYANFDMPEEEFQKIA